MRNKFWSLLRPAISPIEKARIYDIRMPVTKTYPEMLSELKQEVDAFGIDELEARLTNEATILADLQITQKELNSRAETIVFEKLVKKQAEGYAPDVAIEYTANKLAEEGLNSASRLPLDELISGLEVRQLLFKRNFKDLATPVLTGSQLNSLYINKV